MVTSQLINKRQSFSFLVSPACSADTMDVILESCWKVEIDNVTYIGNIETAGSDISCHQNLNPVLFEKIEGFLSARLGFIAMDRFDFKAELSQGNRQFFNAVFCSAKNQNFIEFWLDQKFMEHINLLLFINNSDNILINIRGSITRFDRDSHWMMKEGFNKSLNFRRNGRGKEK